MPPTPITQNTLYCGDNLPLLREYIPTASMDPAYMQAGRDIKARWSTAKYVPSSYLESAE
jgi:hypothetical protein